MNPHFKDVNSIAKMLGNATETQKWNFWTILLDIARTNKTTALTQAAADMDFLLHTISQEIMDKNTKEMKAFIDQHLKENHGRTNDTTVDSSISGGLVQAACNEDEAKSS